MIVIICLLFGASCGGKGGGGGGGGSGGGMEIGGCPPSRPAVGTACIGTFSCNYDDTCRCGVCCYSSYRCSSSAIAFLGSNDGCMQVSCDAGADAIDAPRAVCTPGADQTCNDNPAVSSIRGHCNDAGFCECGTSAHNPDSGRCL